MNVLTDLFESEFHDTSLVSACATGQVLSMAIEYFDSNDIECSMLLTIHGIESITVGSDSISAFSMKTSHGSIIELRRIEKGVRLLVDWIDFSSASNTKCLYILSGANIELRGEPIH